MPTIVELPDSTELEFPDDMDQLAMRQEISKAFPNFADPPPSERPTLSPPGQMAPQVSQVDVPDAMTAGQAPPQADQVNHAFAQQQMQRQAEFAKAGPIQIGEQPATLPRIGKPGTFLGEASGVVAGLGEWAMNNPEELVASLWPPTSAAIAAKYGPGIVKQSAEDVAKAVKGDTGAAGRLFALAGMVLGPAGIKEARARYLTEGRPAQPIPSPDFLAREGMRPQPEIPPESMAALPQAAAEVLKEERIPNAIQVGSSETLPLEKPSESSGEVGARGTPEEKTPLPQEKVEAQSPVENVETIESNESLLGRTNLGQERDEAFAQRAKQIKSTALSLNPGDILIDEDGVRRVVHHVSSDGAVFVYREGGNRLESWEFYLEPGMSIERSKPAPPSTEQALPSEAPADPAVSKAEVPEVAASETAPAMEETTTIVGEDQSASGIGQGPGARTSTPSTKPEAPESHEGTGLKNAIGDLERLSYGFAERSPAEKQSMAEAWVRADAAMKRNTEAGRMLAASLELNPKRGLTGDESAILLRHKVNLENALNDAAEATITEKDPVLKSAANEDVIRLHDELNRFLDTIAERGSEWGREGRWRQALAYSDYTFAAQERLMRAAKGGDPLTDLEREKLTRDVAEHKAKAAELTERLKSEEAKSSQSEAARLLSESRSQAAEKALPAPHIMKLIGELRASVKAAANESRNYFKGRVASFSPEDLYHIGRIAADNLLEIGEDFAKWSVKMAEDLGSFADQARPMFQKLYDDAKKSIVESARGKKIPKTPKTEKVLSEPGPEAKRSKVLSALKEAKSEGLGTDELGKYVKAIVHQVVEGGTTEYGAIFDEASGILKQAGVEMSRDEVAQAYSDYGKSKAAPTEPVKVRLSQLRGEAQKALGLKTVLEKQTPPAATGPRRVKASDLYRRTVAQIHEAMKRLGVVSRDPANQLADALQARKTYRANRIKDLRYEMATGERIVKGKTAPLSDTELASMDAEYQQLKREHAARFLKQPPTELEQIADEGKSLDREIAKLEDDLKTGNVIPGKPTTKPTTPELIAKRSRLEALRDQRNELRELNEEFTRRREADGLNRQRKSLETQINEKTIQLASGDVSTQGKPVSRPAHPVLEKLMQERDSLNRKLSEARKKTEAQKSAEQMQRRLNQLNESIADVRVKIATNDVATKQRQVNRPLSPGLEQARQTLDQLNKELAKLRQKPESQKESEQHQRKIKALDKRAAEVQSKIDSGDVSPKASLVNRPLPPGLEQARQRLEAVNSKLHELRNPKRTPEEIALSGFKASRSRRIADLNDRMARGDFERKAKRTPPILDPEATRLQTELKEIEQRFQEARVKHERESRTPFEKLQDTVVDWSRGVKLLSPYVFPKLAVAGLTRIVTNPIYRAAGQALRLVPGIAEKAPSELGFSLKSESKNIASILKSGPQALAKLVKGKSNLDILEGKLSRNREMSGLIGNAHGMIKEPVKQGAFGRSVELRTEQAIRDGLNPNEPAVSASIISSSLADANREIFMNDNMLTKYLIRLPVNALKMSGKTGSRTIASTIEFLLPIVNVPTNITIAAARLNPVIGFGEALTRLARAAKKGELEGGSATLSAADAESISRAFKYGAVGTFLAAYAWMHPNQFGGVYDEKGPKRNLKPGEIKIMGVTTPAWIGHAPEMSFLNTVAASRRVYERYYRKDPSSTVNASVEALAFSLMSPVKNLPFIDEYLRLFNSYHSPGQTAGQVVRDSVLPTTGILKAFDQQERSPKTFWQEIELGIPGIRSNVPKKKP